MGVASGAFVADAIGAAQVAGPAGVRVGKGVVPAVVEDRPEVVGKQVHNPSRGSLPWIRVAKFIGRRGVALLSAGEVSSTQAGSS